MDLCVYLSVWSVCVCVVRVVMWCGCVCVCACMCGVSVFVCWWAHLDSARTQAAHYHSYGHNSVYTTFTQIQHIPLLNTLPARSYSDIFNNPPSRRPDY